MLKVDGIEISDREWAEDHGFSRARCPHCHQQGWIESGCAFECSCGYTDAEEEPEEADTEELEEETC